MSETKWTTEIPTEPGKYWFYGDPHYGVQVVIIKKMQRQSLEILKCI